MPSDIFEFWSQMRRGEKIHPADREVLARLDPKKHGFRLDCLPACFGGPLRTASLVLLWLSPGFQETDAIEADTEEGRDYYLRRWQGNEPLRGGPHSWIENRTRSFGDWRKLSDQVAILNIGAYHSATFNDYSALAALPSSRVCLDWAQSVLFREAETGRRIVICLRASSYWGLERGRQYGDGLFAPMVTRSGHLVRNDERERLIRLVKARVSA
jgi:hypothetical protein